MSTFPLILEAAFTSGWIQYLLVLLALFTGIAMVLLAIAGGLMALWLAAPGPRARLERHTVNADQQMRDLALQHLDREMDRCLRSVVRNRPISLRTIPGGGRRVLADH